MFLSFFFLPNIAWLYGIFVVPYECQDHEIANLMEIALICKLFQEAEHFKNINSVIHEHGISFYLFFSSHLFN
jgi:hypothetical protein